MEEPKERRNIIADFLKGALDALLAVRVLDEGIDIPGIKTAFLLASTANRRQFVQRRGRILRLDPDNPNKRAKIYDLKTNINPDFINQESLIKNNKKSLALSFVNYISEKEEEREVTFSDDSENKICYNFVGGEIIEKD